MKLLSIITLLLVFQCPYWPGMSMDDLRWIMLFVFTSIAFFCIGYTKAKWIDLIFFIFPLYALIRGIFGYVPGWTGFEVAKWLSMAGVAMVAARLTKRESDIMKWVLIGMACVQIAMWAIPFDWMIMPGMKMEFGFGLYGFGTFRHRTRFATVILAGLIPALAMVRKEKPYTMIYLWIVIGAFIAALLASYSNSVLACAAIAIPITLLRPNKYGSEYVLYATLLIVLFMAYRPSGFALGGERAQLWGQAYAAATDTWGHALWGHGAGAWHLQVMSAHPHNSAIQMLYDYGYTGAVIFYGMAGISILFIGISNPMACVGLALITISTMVNSMVDYPEMILLIALYTGLCVREGYEIV